MRIVSRRWAGLCAVALLAGACATDEFGNRRPLTYAEKGALIGAATGALLGSTADDSKKGTLLGAVGGGITGALVGSYMDSQKKDLEKALAVERAAGDAAVEKLPDNVVRVTMTSQTAFEFDSTEIKPGFFGAMDKIADIFVRYGKTRLIIVGHTDSTGSEEYNQGLSERRAGAVAGYLQARGVIPQRLETHGMGEKEPRASNASAEGRRLNRRVEILVVPIVAEG